MTCKGLGENVLEELARGPGLRASPTWLTFIGRLENQFPRAVENRAAEKEEDGEVTIHVAGAEGSERSISP